MKFYEYIDPVGAEKFKKYIKDKLSPILNCIRSCCKEMCCCCKKKSISDEENRLNNPLNPENNQENNAVNRIN
jgi:hypothetical protein